MHFKTASYEFSNYGHNIVNYQQFWKIHFGWYQNITTPITFWLVDQSSSIFPSSWDESQLITCFSDFGYLNHFQRYSPTKSEVVGNCVHSWFLVHQHTLLYYFFVGGPKLASFFAQHWRGCRSFVFQIFVMLICSRSQSKVVRESC